MDIELLCRVGKALDQAIEMRRCIDPHTRGSVREWHELRREVSARIAAVRADALRRSEADASIDHAVDAILPLVSLGQGDYRIDICGDGRVGGGR